jgi:glycosyltransferase involved in cell wall biosynthesis
MHRRGSKRILMMESGSFKVIGGAAKDTYGLYSKLSLRKDYSIDLYGNFSGIDKHAKTVTLEQLMSRDYDFVWMNSIRDVAIADAYRRRHPRSRARFLYVDRGNVLLNLRNAKLKRLLPKMVARRRLVSKLVGFLDYYVAIGLDQYNYARRFFKGRTSVKYILIAPHEEFRVLGTSRNFNGALAAGRLDERQKKINFMIRGIAKVIEEHPELRDKELLRIVGSGVDEGRYRSLARSLRLGKNIRFKGFMVGEELVRAYNNAAFLVSTSEWEGLSRVLLEAMACGLPLLINDRINTAIRDSPVTRIVREQYNGLVYRYGGLEDFAGEFYRLYSDRKLQKRLASNARRFIKQFSFMRVVEDYERIIDNA